MASLPATKTGASGHNSCRSTSRHARPAASRRCAGDRAGDGQAERPRPIRVPVAERADRGGERCGDRRPVGAVVSSVGGGQHVPAQLDHVDLPRLVGDGRGEHERALGVGHQDGGRASADAAAGSRDLGQQLGLGEPRDDLGGRARAQPEKARRGRSGQAGMRVCGPEHLHGARRHDDPSFICS